MQGLGVIGVRHVCATRLQARSANSAQMLNLKVGGSASVVLDSRYQCCRMCSEVMRLAVLPAADESCPSVTAKARLLPDPRGQHMHLESCCVTCEETVMTFDVMLDVACSGTRMTLKNKASFIPSTYIEACFVSVKLNLRTHTCLSA